MNIRDFYKVLDKRLVPHARCVSCAYKMSCGMCRLTPLMHGYTEGFGYDDCQPFMRDVLEMLAARKPEGHHHRFHCVSQGASGKIPGNENISQVSHSAIL